MPQQMQSNKHNQKYRIQTYTSCSLMAEGSSFFFFCVFALSCSFLNKKNGEKQGATFYRLCILYPIEFFSTPSLKYAFSSIIKFMPEMIFITVKVKGPYKECVIEAQQEKQMAVTCYFALFLQSMHFSVNCMS